MPDRSVGTVQVRLVAVESETRVSTSVRSVDGPVSSSTVTPPVAPLQVRVKVEPGVRSKALLVKATLADTADAREARTATAENFIFAVGSLYDVLSSCGWLYEESDR